MTDLGRNRCLLRGSLSTFIGWRCKENANRMQNIKLAWIFCWDAAFLLQRKCKRAQWKLAFKLPSAGFLLQRYNKKQLFAIVCSDFVLKSAHIFNIYTENQVVTKPLNISHLKKESVSFLSKSFLSFSKNKNTFHLYKEYIYKYIFIYIFFIELFFHFQNRKWQKWLWQKWQG